RTFRGGDTVTSSPSTPTWIVEYVKLPDDPNDFHFIGDQWITPGGTTTIACWTFWNTFYTLTFHIEIYAPISPYNTHWDFTYDFTLSPSDPNMLVKHENSILYNGPRSQFTPGSFNLMLVEQHNMTDTARQDCNTNGIPDG